VDVDTSGPVGIPQVAARLARVLAADQEPGTYARRARPE
jgi:hypothetical protein